MVKTQSAVQPEEVVYMALPDGSADVWLHRNAEQTTDEDGTVWEAEEVYIRTSLSEEEVKDQFDAIFENPDAFMIEEAMATLEETTGETSGALDDLAEQVAALTEAIKEVKAELTTVATAVNAGEAIEIAEDGTILDKSAIKEAEPIEGSL